MVTIAALYHFAHVPDPEALAPKLRDLADAHHVRGLLLLAHEGINGTIAGSRIGIDIVQNYIKSLEGFSGLEAKESCASEMPFGRLKVRVKKEIVTMGQPDVDPICAVGQYVDPADWNALISSDDVVVIDTRNDYEVAIGTFQGAIDPQTGRFRDFPQWWQANKDRFHDKRIAMFCTGGIRCEKSTNYLMNQGVKNVYHLKGGILKYLEEVPSEESLWQGACFVFDERVSVTHGLAVGPHVLCRACRRPLENSDLSRPEYEMGVSCHHCLSEHSDADRKRFRERQKQIALSAARGEHHLARGQ